MSRGDLTKITITKDKGDVLFYKGDAATFCYIIKKGQIEIFVYDSDGNTVILDTIRTGDIFGDMALILSSPRTAGARAVVKSELLCLSRDNFLDIIMQNTEFAVKLIMVFRERLKKVNNKLLAVKMRKIKVFNLGSYQECLKSSQRLFCKGT
ncbi:MAG: cyclic nucleotide-binding domain-containing protein, partial [Candidatus Wallbacteria bacterium]|nr:cyclic nucleotide-binding domain-containing protein [Candidatus Wallbacteria bacterium]